MNRVFVALLALSLTSTALARLGETEVELVKRFGTVVQRGVEQTIAQGRMLNVCPRLGFSQGAWGITCYMINGRCERISYWKNGDWTEEQFQKVLNSNAQGYLWIDTSKEMTKALIKSWKRDDGAYASWNIGAHTMTVTNPAFDRLIEQVHDMAKSAASEIPKI